MAEIMGKAYYISTLLDFLQKGRKKVAKSLETFKKLLNFMLI